MRLYLNDLYMYFKRTENNCTHTQSVNTVLIIFPNNPNELWVTTKTRSGIYLIYSHKTLCIQYILVLANSVGLGMTHCWLQLKKK